MWNQPVAVMTNMIRVGNLSSPFPETQHGEHSWTGAQVISQQFCWVYEFTGRSESAIGGVDGPDPFGHVIVLRVKRRELSPVDQ